MGIKVHASDRVAGSRRQRISYQAGTFPLESSAKDSAYSVLSSNDLESTQHRHRVTSPCALG